MPASPARISQDRHRSTGFLLLYALAYTGGVVAYLPLLTLLLPLKIEALAGEARIGVFSATIIAGALAASGANVLFGWLSDRSVARGQGRRRWLCFGLIATVLSYAAVAAAASSAAIILAVTLFQVAVNAMLAPLLAIMADEVPDAQKGVAGGLLAAAVPGDDLDIRRAHAVLVHDAKCTVEAEGVGGNLQFFLVFLTAGLDGHRTLRLTNLLHQTGDQRGIGSGAFRIDQLELN